MRDCGGRRRGRELPGQLRSTDAGEGSHPRSAGGARTELCACGEQIVATGDSSEAGVYPKESSAGASGLVAHMTKSHFVVRGRQLAFFYFTVLWNHRFSGKFLLNL